MKSLKFALAAVGLALIATPAIAQDIGSGPDSQQFVDAVQKRDGDKATQLIENHPRIINARDSHGDTALIIAIKRSDSDWTGFLLHKDADPNAAGAAGDTPLIAAARVGFDEAAEWLLGLGAKVDEDNKMGETPLIVAVQQRDARLVKLLLDHGANPDKTDAAAGYSARDYAKRDPRAREILRMIDNKKPKDATAPTK
jgi:ankyrin repeat protein